MAHVRFPLFHPWASSSSLCNYKITAMCFILRFLVSSSAVWFSKHSLCEIWREYFLFQHNSDWLIHSWPQNIFISTQTHYFLYFNTSHRKTYKYSLIYCMCVICARQMWKRTHTCLGQKIKLGPPYIIRNFNGRLKWEIRSICVVSLRDQERRQWSSFCMNPKVARGIIEAIWWRRRGEHEECHHQDVDILSRSPGCHITCWEILLSPACWNRLLLGDFTAVTRDWVSQHAVRVEHTHSCIFVWVSPLTLPSFRWSCPAPCASTATS